MKGGLAIFMGGKPKGMGEEKPEPEEDDESGDPARAALDGLKAAIEEDDPRLLVKAWKLLQRCCADEDEDDEAPESEES